MHLGLLCSVSLQFHCNREILGGNVNAVYRFNISVNDGWRSNPNWADSNNTIWINNKISGEDGHFCDSVYIYNNTIVIDRPFTTAIYINSKNTYIYNNIFYSVGGSGMGVQRVKIVDNGTAFSVSNNLFWGNVAPEFTAYDQNAVEADPQFIYFQNDSLSNYQLSAESQAIDAGLAKPGPPISGAGKGIFLDVPQYPAVDYYGNPVDLINGKPNIGACNAKNGETVSSISKTIYGHGIKIYPNPVQQDLFISGFRRPGGIKIYSIQGALLHRGMLNSRIDVRFLNPGMYILDIEGHKMKFLKNSY